MDREYSEMFWEKVLNEREMGKKSHPGIDIPKLGYAGRHASTNC